jgi:TonB family protein
MGPATRRRSLPVGSLLLSSLVHGAGIAAILAAALLWRDEPSKTYFVNLEPAVPAQGTPTGQTSTPTAPPRVEEPAPPKAVKSAAPPELPSRESFTRTAKSVAVPELPSREAAKPSRPAALPDLPARSAVRPPEMPARELPRVATRPGQKESPALALPPPSAAPRSGPASPSAAPPPPPAALGRPTGAAQGSGTVASAEGDFPFQWYLTAVQRKIYEQWAQPFGAQGQKAVIVFEIARNGEVNRVRVEKPSGDATYDLAALRAVTNASPLPPLPEQFKGPMLRVHFGFEFTGRG